MEMGRRIYKQAEAGEEEVACMWGCCTCTCGAGGHDPRGEAAMAGQLA
jgi:hypothetical protein